MDKAHHELLRQCLGFDWDKGNIEKNRIKHDVAPSECEQIFFNRPLLIHDDTLHSAEEQRFYALGRTDMDRPFCCLHCQEKVDQNHFRKRYEPQRKEDIW